MQLPEALNNLDDPQTDKFFRGLQWLYYCSSIEELIGLFDPVIGFALHPIPTGEIGKILWFTIIDRPTKRPYNP